MAARRIPPEVQKMFDRYTHNNVRRLRQPDAIKLLSTEFHLSEQHAEEFFRRFDADRNGQLSLWEFQHFYNVVGDRASEIVNLFEKLDQDENGKLTLEEAREGMDTLKTADGAQIDAREVEAAFKVICGEAGEMDLGEFIDLLVRLRFYGRPVKPGTNK